MSRAKEDLVPLRPGEVGIYSCGVTVYDLSHIGHARSALVFDAVVRYLRWRGLSVRFVRNYTDVDDKIIRRANQEGVSPNEVSERYIRAYREDMASLGIGPADVEPRATEHIPQMIALIERLVAKGVAYEVDGDVYFEVRRFPPYGRLSGKNLDDLLAGARVEVDERKRDPRDFALWKSAKPGEPSWPSPWGQGRPGWHIECSAMAMEYLGQSLDIHGGGEDLIFPHHECEIAQSEAVTGVPFARLWMHNGMVNMGAEKMSKSLGNIRNIRDLVARHDPDAIRLHLLGTHYRNPLEFGEERIAEAARALARLRAVAGEAGPDGAPPAAASGAARAEIEAHRARFVAAMDDDFNTPQALGVLFDLARLAAGWRDRAGTAGDRGDFLAAAADVRALGRVLGLFERALAPRAEVSADLRARVESLVARRTEARRRRDWAEADRLRGELSGLGVVVEDTPQGTTWKLG
jgi:cysteinyl-tRNA synthetase